MAITHTYANKPITDTTLYQQPVNHIIIIMKTKFELLAQFHGLTYFVTKYKS